MVGQHGWPLLLPLRRYGIKTKVYRFNSRQAVRSIHSIDIIIITIVSEMDYGLKNKAFFGANQNLRHSGKGRVLILLFFSGAGVIHAAQRYLKFTDKAWFELISYQLH